MTIFCCILDSKRDKYVSSRNESYSTNGGINFHKVPKVIRSIFDSAYFFFAVPFLFNNFAGKFTDNLSVNMLVSFTSLLRVVLSVKRSVHVAGRFRALYSELTCVVVAETSGYNGGKIEIVRNSGNRGDGRASRWSITVKRKFPTAISRPRRGLYLLPRECRPFEIYFFRHDVAQGYLRRSSRRFESIRNEIGRDAFCSKGPRNVEPRSGAPKIKITLLSIAPCINYN